MSLIVAIRKNGRIYMAADTQSTCGDIKFTRLGKDAKKIEVFENGMMLGHTGLVHNTQIVCAHPELFTLPEDGILTKRHVVQNIIPRLYKCYKDHEMLMEKENAPVGADNEFLLAHGDRLFHINKWFEVSAVGHYAAVGSGTDIALPGLVALDAEGSLCDTEIEERLVELLRIASSRVTSVSGPFYTIDSTAQTFRLAQ